jgi:lysophospholipase L1-like esterase
VRFVPVGVRLAGGTIALCLLGAAASVGLPSIAAQVGGPGAIGDLVWSDRNGNGIQDSGEPGVSGVRISVRSGAGTTLGSAVSDGSGRFLVASIPAEIVTVVVDLASIPAGSRLSPPSQTGWTLDSDFDQTSGTTRSYASAGGNLHVDLGLIGVGVQATTTTAAPTTAATTSVPATTIRPVTTSPATTSPTTSSVTTIAGGGINGQVWTDANADGRRDAGESGRGGLVIGLHRVVSGGWVWQATTTTDSGGRYAFSGIGAGTFAVVVDRGTTVGFSPADNGSDDRDSDVNSLGFTTVTAPATIDAGVLTTVSATTVPPTTIPPTTIPPLTTVPGTTVPPTTIPVATTTIGGCRPVRIMPLGDSITAWPDSYRGYLYQWLQSQGRNIDFVGTQQWQPTVGGDANHQGHGGYTIGPDSNVDWQGTPGNLDYIVPTAIPVTQPDIILLAIGANDIAGGGTIASEAPNRLAALVTKIRQYAPNSWIIVGDQLPNRWSPNSSPTIDALNARARSLGEASATDRVVWGNTLAGVQAQGFDVNVDLQDPSHLSASGGQKYSVAWRPTVTAALNAVGCLR